MVTDLESIPNTGERDRVDRATRTLVGSRCPECSATSWPSRAKCQRCGATTDMTYRLPRTGTLLSHTTVWVSRPGLEAPYALGQVSVDGSIFFGHIRGLAEGALVPLDVQIHVSNDDADVLFWFEPTAAPPSSNQ